MNPYDVIVVTAFALIIAMFVISVIRIKKDEPEPVKRRYKITLLVDTHKDGRLHLTVSEWQIDRKGNLWTTDHAEREGYYKKSEFRSVVEAERVDITGDVSADKM